MTAVAVQVVMLTDAQLDTEIEAVESEVCCPSYAAAAAALCGCRGAAGEYLARLLAEAQRRQDGAA
jgi:hypothetical protein